MYIVIFSIKHRALNKRQFDKVEFEINASSIYLNLVSRNWLLMTEHTFR